MDENSQITLSHAYRAMCSFVDAYWRRGGQADDQIASMIGDMQFGESFGPTKTADPAQWNDWLDAVKKVS